MKRGIINMLMALAASATMFFVGCIEPEEPTIPQFPEKITASVEAGEEYEFSITANMAWSLAIPDEVATYFKFIDGESERYSLSGEAGTHKVVVGVSNKEEFDVVRVCEISMTMGSQTQVVATITRGGKERSLVMYIAEYNAEEETFATDAEGNWVFSTTPAERLDWVWSNEQWMQRVVIESNFDWFLSPEAPKWLNINTTEGVAGRTELFLRVNREQLPLEDVECNIEFGVIYITNSTDGNFETIGSYPTAMEGCGDVCEVSLPAQMLFNSEGDYYQASSDSYVSMANGRFSSPRGAELVLLSKNADGSYTSDATSTRWMRIKMDDFPEEAGEIGVWERSFTFDVAKHTNPESREGAIAALPKPVAESGNYNPEEYIVCHVTQDKWVEEVVVETIYANDNEIMEAYNSKFEKLTNGAWPWMGSWKSIPYGYKLTYNNNESGDDLIFTQPFTRYEIYGFDGDGKAPYDPETCWLTIEPSEEHKGLENGYIIRSRLNEKENDITYTNTMPGSYGENEATIIFYNENEEAYALIYFILDPSYYTPVDHPDGVVTFADDKDYDMLNAHLEEITEEHEEYSPEMAYAGTLQYMLILNSNCQEATLLVPNYLMSYPYATWLYTTDGAGKITIHIDTASLPEVDADTNEIRSNITLYGENYVQVVQLTVVYRL